MPDSPNPNIPVLEIADLDLPREVATLYDLAYDLWWTFCPEAQRLFRSIHEWSWTEYRNPVQLLHNIDRVHWEELIARPSFMSNLKQVSQLYSDYHDQLEESWFHQAYPNYDEGPVAYFSTEYGLHETLPLYSGGLGVLSADQCKAASDLGLPFIAVGLLYRHGYFNQTVDADGVQQHTYPDLDFARLGARPVADRDGQALIVQVPFPGREIAVKVWKVQIGRVPLLLLDTDIRMNDPTDRPITSMLYVQGREMRLAQEVILGVGGVKALEALRIVPAVWHANEGHSALLQLERARTAVEELQIPLAQALDLLRNQLVFTTHTTVPAGQEQFDRKLASKYLEPWASLLKVDAEALINLGAADHNQPDQPFNLTAFALRTSHSANGVSMANAELNNRQWHHLPGEIQGITNGVHVPTWLGTALRDVLVRHFGRGWLKTLHSDDAAEALEQIPERELWAAHQAQKEELARFLRARLLKQYARHGWAPDELREVGGLFDVDTLCIGFARRFALYKRAGLIFSDLHRLRGLLSHPTQPVEIVIAGKAHPADRAGQELIQHLFQLGQEEGLRGRVVFLESYDLRIGRALTQGVDVWLNTPRPGLEACGTSGQKAAINGVLNCSVPDGWWPEAYEPGLGWSIDGGSHADEWHQDQSDALALYRLLEEELVPTYYERDDDGLPGQWLSMMKRSIAAVAGPFSGSRMMQDYTEQMYLPASAAQEAAPPTKEVGP